MLGCVEGSPSSRWEGVIDTLPSGHIVTESPAAGLWTDAERWILREDLRIGQQDGDGPDLFGQITAFDVDDSGRVYVFEGQSQELRVFDQRGGFVRTVGRRGGGPGEFAQVIGMAWSPNGLLWLVDPGNNRISVIDTAGVLRESHHTAGGFAVVPWPGGFDDRGTFYNVAFNRSTRGFGVVLVAHNAELEPIDTILPPANPATPNFWSNDAGTMRASVPFSPGLVWRLHHDGGMWFASTGDYTLHKLSPQGDTVRTVRRDFAPVPVTSADVDNVIEEMEWFTRQGGKVERSKIPNTKPSMTGFFVDEEENVWVTPTIPAGGAFVWDVFDSDGRYLGAVEVPVNITGAPIFRDGVMYARAPDEFGVPYVVRMRIDKPGEG